MALKLADFTLQSLELVQGMEKRLRLRQRNASFALVLTVAGVVTEVALAAIKDEKYRESLRQLGCFVNKLLAFDFSELVQGGLPLPEFTGALLIVGGLAGYATLRWTGILLQESQEPFRYTFQVSQFKGIEGTPDKRFALGHSDRFMLLHHDLTERLNQRIQRLSWLDLSSDTRDDLKNRSLTSHIHIDGDYVIREESDGKWIIQVVARVRIGALDRPSQITRPAKLQLQKEPESTNPATPCLPPTTVYTAVLKTDDYNHLVELVYSRVATEIYRQIETDIHSKVALFPTKYLRAVALSCEAEDFARSNTIDAYDRAIDLYRQALRYFRVADLKPIGVVMLRLPSTWRKEEAYHHHRAAVVTGYSKCLIYRRKLSALTGRYRNPLFEVPLLLTEVIHGLETLQFHITGVRGASRTDHGQAVLSFPRDTWDRQITYRPLEARFDKQRKIYFDALVTAALAYKELDAIGLAKEYLADARALDVARSERDPLYLLTKGELEPDLDRQMQLFQQAAEIAPDFQIAVFRLAYCDEMRLRRAGEMTKNKADRVTSSYETIIQNINPGNIAALAAQGYLYWLVRDLKGAENKFLQGLALKELAQETFVGELNYGLARIAAEQNLYEDCYTYYRQAIATDPGVAAHTASASTRGSVAGAYYEYITCGMLERYWRYQDTALNSLKTLMEKRSPIVRYKESKDCSRRTLEVVRSFVLNDYGNACFNYFRRFGLASYLEAAIQAYEQALEADRENAVAHYNLASALNWMLKNTPLSQYTRYQEKIVQHLKRAGALAPTWPSIDVAVTVAEWDLYIGEIRYNQGQIDIKESACAEYRKTLKEVEKEIKKLESPTLASPTAEHPTLAGRREPTGAGKKPWELMSEVDFGQVNLSLYQQRLEELEKKRSKEGQVQDALLDQNEQKRGQSLEQKRDLEREIEKLKEDINAARQRIDDRRKELQKTLVRLREVISRTRFGPLYEGKLEEIDDKGGGVKTLLSVNVYPERVDEKDIGALEMWAQVLWSTPEYWRVVAKADASSSQESRQQSDRGQIALPLEAQQNLREALESASQLSTFLAGYSPENFDRILSIQDAIEAVSRYEEGVRDAVGKYDTDELASQLRAAVTHAVDSDPIHWATLKWITNSRVHFIDDDKQKALRVEGELEVFNQSSGCLQVRGEYYRMKEDWDAAVAEFQRATELAPEEATFWNDLGRTYFLWGRFNDAVNPYEEAVKLSEQNAIYHGDLAEAYEKLKRWKEACEEYQHARDLAQEANENVAEATYLPRLKWAYNSWGNEHFDRRQYSEAIKKYEQALGVDASDAVIHSNLSEAWERLIPEDENAIDNAIKALTSATEIRKPGKDDYSQRLKHLKSIRDPLGIVGHEAYARLPLVTPIALEIAADLIPRVTEGDNLARTFQEKIDGMRDSLYQDYGVRIPGIRVRGNETDLPTGTYIIMLMEVPIVSGNVDWEKRMVLAAPEALADTPVVAEPAVDPLTGTAASWLQESDAASLPADRFETCDAVGYMVRHLQSVLVSNLPDFQGVQETRNLLIDSERADRLAPVQTTPHGLVGLTMVLKALLAEQVSIVPIGEIVDEFLRPLDPAMKLPDLVEALRRVPAVRERLLINKPQARTRWFALDSSIEKQVRQSLYSANEIPVLAMEPEAVQNLLTSIRNAVSGGITDAALLVTDATIRPHLRTLVELEFPGLHVYAREEVNRLPEATEITPIR